MKSSILQIISQYPKHYSKIIKNNKELMGWVNQNKQLQSTQFAEEIYSAIYQQTNLCANGNVKKFKDITTGFVGCGPANRCQCTRSKVSEKVAATKKLLTAEDQVNINEKRAATNFSKYGYENAGQSTHAKQKHAELYTDALQVGTIVDRVAATKLLKYNNKNFNNRTKSIATNIQRYGSPNTWALSESHSNPKLIYLKDKEKLTLLYSGKTVQEIADFCEVHINTVYKKLYEHGLRDKYKSTFEKEIIDYIRTIIPAIVVISNTRSLISKEIDIYLPEYNIAIEYNGVWWHHDKITHITKQYHYQKFIDCEQQGIKLLTIFSNSWEDKKVAWKNKIRSMLHQSEKQIYARKCKIVAVTSAQTRPILENNHIQGYTNAEYCYGLEHEGNIVAVMTFSKSRRGIGKNRGDDAYELVRYVTSCSVVGGASKLLAQFERVHTPKIIVSYSDNRYSHGNLYNILNFTLESENKFNYWYYDAKLKKSFHRYKFAKHQLVKAGYDPAKTEHQITDEIGLLRIWDCGSRTWVKQF